MSRRVRRIYRGAGVKPPDGKGIHTEAFHRRSAAIMKGYKENGLTKKERQIAHATAMKQLGADKAVKPSHRRRKKKKR